MRKKVRILALSMTFVLSVCGACSVKDNSIDSPKESGRYTRVLMGISPTEDGIIYVADDELIHYQSKETQESIILCPDPACEHKPAGAENPDPKCRAALFYERTKIGCYEDSIYYLVNNGAFEHDIYKMDISGSGRNEVASFEFAYNAGQGMLFCDDSLYYVASFRQKNENTGKITYYERLIEVNLNDYSYKLYPDNTEDDGARIPYFDVNSGYIYIRISYNEADPEGFSYIKRYKLSDGSEEIIKDKEDALIFVGPCDSESYYFLRDGVAGIKNINTGKETVIFTPGTEEKTGTLIVYKTGILYREVLDGEVQDYFYNNRTQKITKVSCDRYSLYDRSNDMFVCPGDMEGAKVNSYVIKDFGNVIAEVK